MDPLSSGFVPNAVLPDERAMVNSASKIQKFFRRRWSRSKQDRASDNGGYVSNVDDEVEAPQDVHSEGSETFSEMCPDEELEVTWMSMGDFRDQFFQLLSLDEIRDYHMEGLRDYDQKTWHRIAACDSHELQHRSAEDQIVGQCSQTEADCTPRTWEPAEIQIWFQVTVRFANQAALAACDSGDDPSSCLEKRMAVVQERWGKARRNIPEFMRDGIWNMLCEQPEFRCKS